MVVADPALDAGHDAGGQSISVRAAIAEAEKPPDSPDEWERWWLQITRKAIVADYLVHHGGSGSPDGDQTRLVHASCNRELRARQRRDTALQS